MKKTLLIVAILSFLTLTINAQEGKIHVGGQVGLSLPMGDFGDAANMGFGFLGNFYYGINQNIDLTASLGYIAWGTDADGASFSNIPIVVGGRYYFQRSNFTPFLAAELGINNLSFTFAFVKTFYTRFVYVFLINSFFKFIFYHFVQRWIVNFM